MTWDSSMAREFHVNNTLSHFSFSLPHIFPHILMPSNDEENNKKKVNNCVCKTQQMEKKTK